MPQARSASAALPTKALVLGCAVRLVESCSHASKHLQGR